jgi:hypothetical protein
LEKESEANIQFTKSKTFESNYLKNEITFTKNLRIVSDVSLEDIKFNWPFVISILVVVFSVFLLYMPLGWCWYVMHKKRFEQSLPSDYNPSKKGESDEEGKRLEMIELQAYHRESEQQSQRENLEKMKSLGNSQYPLNKGNNFQDYDLNMNPEFYDSTQFLFF